MKKIKTALKLSALSIVTAFSLATGTVHAQQSPVINNTANLQTKAPMPVGSAPAIFNSPGGECGEGFSLSIGGPYVGVGGGKTKQNETCLKQRAATDVLRAGFAGKDSGVTAAGLGALGEIHPEINKSIATVAGNLMLPCAREAEKISALLLTEKLRCTADNHPYIMPVLLPPAP